MSESESLELTDESEEFRADASAAPGLREPADAAAGGPETAGSAQGEAEGGQRVSWAECFFDLVVALAVTDVSRQLQLAPDWGALGRSLLLLIPFWWGWVGTALLFNGLRMTPARKHLLLLGIALGALLMSTCVAGAYGARGVFFGLSYLCVRVLLGVPMRARGVFGLRLDPFTVSLFIGAPLYVIGGLTPNPFRVWIWLLAACVEIGSTAVRPRRFAHMRWEPAHLPERFGLFVIIVLGETIATIGSQAAAHTMSPAVVIALILAFVLAAGLWWAYFPMAMPAIEFAMRTTVIQTRIVRDVFSYGHLLLAAGVLLTAAGSSVLVAEPTRHPHGVTAYLAGLGVALYILAFCHNRHKMFGGVGTLRAAATVLAAACACTAPLLPGWATLAVNDAILLTLHLVEDWRVRTGRPLLLLPWPRHASA
ncbi:low temperature requirement protein A [Actinospica durhamensis]|uniref:Low temperature requirement protein A n=1 Tax=Actinospica durhamensis TaxID=1508375 RepID=A0A941ELQ3_9ACTN|nr:low temperature requirement protein A [Actinospica durhamensis]MBR7832852.1 low temperature requirement protein A [Actinospica durhamensis]